MTTLDAVVASKETADRRPTAWQAFRSALPYESFPASPRRGTVVADDAGGIRYWAYIPEEAKRRPLPVLYHLHGAGVRWTWVRRDVTWIAQQQELAVEATQGVPMVVIAPYDPTHFSMWADDVRGSHSTAHLVTEVLRRHVESTYDVLRGRANTHIQGFSMGGFGAATLGLKHQDLYGTVGIFDGAMHDWSTFTEGHPTLAAEQFGGDPDVFARWSPWAWARRADLSCTPVFIAEGLMANFNRRYRDHLRGLGGDVEYVITNRLHDLRGLQRDTGLAVYQFMASARAARRP
ncbi:MAG: alpha/beta hydrolase-fold protein [Myxococcota bacterium]